MSLFVHVCLSKCNSFWLHGWCKCELSSECEVESMSVVLRSLSMVKSVARSHTRRRVRVWIPVPGDIPMATVVQCRKFILNKNRDRYPSLIGYCSHFTDRAPSPREVCVCVNEPLGPIYEFCDHEFEYELRAWGRINEFKCMSSMIKSLNMS